jgi:hypothetical protein
MKILTKVFAAVVGLLGFASSVAAQTPVAVVEDVQGKVTGAEFMDYVAPGNVIKLGPKATVVLGYMKSCRRETITGIGMVIVGMEESMVHEAEVKASKVRCPSDHSRAVDQEVIESAATSFRGIEITSAPPPQFVLYGVSPIFEIASPGKLMVERLDVKGERFEVNLATASLLRGRFYDFAKSGISLRPGGTYAATLGSQRIVFLIDRRAESGATPIVGRLVRLQ